MKIFLTHTLRYSPDSSEFYFDSDSDYDSSDILTMSILSNITYHNAFNFNSLSCSSITFLAMLFHCLMPHILIYIA